MGHGRLTEVLAINQTSSRHWFQHGANTGLETDFTQPSIADAGIEDACPRTIMVVPDHWRQTVIVTEGVGELTTGELKVIHQVVNPLEPPSKGEINAPDNVLQMNPGIE